MNIFPILKFNPIVYCFKITILKVKRYDVDKYFKISQVIFQDIKTLLLPKIKRYKKLSIFFFEKT